MPRRLKIAYLCDQSPLDKNVYSGGNAQIFKTLEKHVGDVHILNNSWGLVKPIYHFIEALPEALNIRLKWRIHILLSRIIAISINRQLRQEKFDVLFGAYSFHSLANVVAPPDVFKAYTSDATMTTYRESEIGQAFGNYVGLSRYLDPLFYRAERKVFISMDLLLWPSEWMKSIADARYGLEEAQSVMVPWGANATPTSCKSDAPEMSPAGPVKLLLIGRDWMAKGGPLAFETMMVLRARGVDAKLEVIGTSPPEGYTNEHVTLYGLLDKNDPAQFKQFEMILKQAHFLLQPSFESYGFAFCEASAYALPSLCLRVGGVPVRDGINGKTLPGGSNAEDFADVILTYVDDPASYRKLCKSTRIEYEEKLNWDAWGKQVASILAARGIADRNFDVVS